MQRQSFITGSLRAFAAAATCAAFMVGAVVPARAQEKLTHYDDVDAGVWYESAAAALLDMGALDDNENRLRPQNDATRAEIATMLVRMRDHDLERPSRPSFDDVPDWSWYFPYMETAAEHGYFRGDRNCYEHSRPCTVRPNDGLIRAEIAAVLVRAFDLDETGDAPRFPDVPRGIWYEPFIQAAADHCVLQGDDFRGTVRPAALVNRAEMVAMFHRASLRLDYDADCRDGEEEDVMTEARVIAADRIELRFDTDIDESRADELSRYTISRIGAQDDVDIDDVNVTGDRTVELFLTDDMRENRDYRVNVFALRTEDGRTFSDSVIVTGPEDDDDTQSGALITGVSVTAGNRVIVTFSRDLDDDRAEEESRYAIDSFNNNVLISDAVQLDDRRVELRLGENLETQANYTLTVTGMRTQDGMIFSDSETFSYDTGAIAFRADFSGTLGGNPPTAIINAGSGSFTLTSTGLQYSINIRAFSGSILGADFRGGSLGQSGSILETISFGNGFRAAGTWTGLTAEERRMLLDEMIFVSVRPSLGGDFRGQLDRQ